MSKSIKWQRFWKRFKAVIILLVAVIAFGIMGLFQGSGLTSTGGAAAQVNGEAISVAEFRRAVSAIEQRFGFNIGNLPEQQRNMFMARMYEQAMNDLVVKELLSQVAETEGIYVPDEQVAGFIIDIPAFQSDGHFNRQNYENYLNSIRSQPSEFEENLRKSFLYSRIQGLFALSSAPSTPEIELLQKGQDTKLDIEFLKFTSEDMISKVADSDVQAYLKDEANKEAIETYYNINKSEYKQEEQVKARHILAKFGSEKDSDQKAKEKIEQAQKRLKTEAFAKVAKELSDDTMSAKVGGDLGFFGRKKMVPSFEKAAFGAELNKVVGPIKSTFGYHLILVEDKKEESTATLEEVKEDIARKLVKEKRAREDLEEFTKVVSSGDYSKVKAWTKGRNLKWESTGSFSLDQASIPKIGNDTNLIAPVLKAKKGELVNKVINGDGFKYVMFLKDMQVQNTEVTEDIRTQIKTRVTQQAFRPLFQNWVNELVKEAKIVKNDRIVQSSIPQ